MTMTRHALRQGAVAAAHEATLVCLRRGLIAGLIAAVPLPAVAQSAPVVREEATRIAAGQRQAAPPSRPQPPTGPRPVTRPTRPAFPRGFVAVNGAYQLSSESFSESVTVRENAEDGRLQTSYTVRRAPGLAISGGGMITPRFGVGASVSRFTKRTPGALTADVPHPFFFGRPRAISGEAGDLEREEFAIHLQLRATVPLTRRIELSVGGGPSLFRIRQGLVSDIAYTEVYPYDVATFRSADVVTATESALGFNAGADGTFFFTRAIGLGVSATFARSSVDLPVNERVLRVDVGGLSTAAGLRFRF